MVVETRDGRGYMIKERDGKEKRRVEEFHPEITT
jgi:hypothetical protein